MGIIYFTKVLFSCTKQTGAGKSGTTYRPAPNWLSVLGLLYVRNLQNKGGKDKPES